MNIGLFTGGTAGGTDGSLVTALNPIATANIAADGSEHDSAWVYFHVRTVVAGTRRTGSFTIELIGATANCWQLAPDASGVAGTPSNWGDPLIISGPISDTNTRVWIRARSLPSESVVSQTDDSSVSIRIPDDIVGVIGRSWAMPYKVALTLVGRSWALPFTIRSVVGKSWALPYVVSGLLPVGRSWALPYVLNNVVGRSWSTPYSIINTVGQSWGLPYAIKNSVGRSWTLPYAIQSSGVTIQWVRLEMPDAQVGASDPSWLGVMEIQASKSSDGSNAFGATSITAKDYWTVFGEYPPANAFDGSTAVGWYTQPSGTTPLASWIQAKISAGSTACSKIRVYCGLNDQNPRTINVFTSNAASPGAKTYGSSHADWTSRGSITPTATNGWYELNL